MSAAELETATREALDRDHRLRCESQRDGYTPKARVDWQANSGSGISEILFVPDPSGHEGRCVVTVSKGIWCTISLWDIQALGRECEVTQPKPKKIGSWGPRGAIFSAIAVNSDCHSEASAAVAVNLYGEHRVYILSFFDNISCGYTPRVQVLRSWNPTLSVCNSVSLCGDTLVVVDSRDRVIAVNVHSPETGVVALESTTVSDHPQTPNICLQIQISRRYILVARAKFVEVFNFPTNTLTTDSSSADSVFGNVRESIVLHPVDSFSFGWLDGISISQDTTKPDSFFVLLRQPDEDPWSMHAPTLTLYSLEASPTADVVEGLPPHSNTSGSSSHLFSETFLASVPLSASTSPTSTSSSASTKLVLGNKRTALWLSPRPGGADSTGLIQMDLNRQEDWPFQARAIRIWEYSTGDDLVWASFGPRRIQAETQGGDEENRTSTAEEEDSKADAFTRRIFNSCGEFWTAIGYDEETGRVALGRRDGYITFLPCTVTLQAMSSYECGASQIFLWGPLNTLRHRVIAMGGSKLYGFIESQTGETKEPRVHYPASFFTRFPRTDDSSVRCHQKSRMVCVWPLLNGGYGQL
ncbi:hypothetical protein BDM02DRAFT_1407797 [Thelephora ganbajun]|uniref:Uncharacterized protein n=1 Tax=Thelephora ganbajun TaxID=370292 RepID=A0ACB6Z2C8_THEGA|nr:hypothetical protein BDM02DRAFT_1407797 [Thelephora ganbajun]